MVDIPYAQVLGDERVTQLSGWGMRGQMELQISPPELLEDAVALHGEYPGWLSEDFDRSLRSERRHLRESLRMVDAKTGVLEQMLSDHRWDLAVVVYWEAHNAAHMFHRYSDPSHLHHDPARAGEFGDALLQVYRRLDRGIGKLLAGASADTEVVVFSQYGLRSCTNGREIVPRLLERLGYTVPRFAPPLARAANAARSLFPWSIRRHVNARLSPEAKARMTERMFADSIDWRRTRAVVESEFGHAWIRVNLRGREPEGTVEKGSEYEALCDEIARELLSVVEPESGEPAITAVLRTRDLVDGPNVDELPDLLVRFTDDRMVTAVRHPRAGLVEEDLRDLPKTEHTGDGFLIAAGPQIRRGGRAEGDIVDIAPTLLHLMGLPAPDEMDGEAIEGLIDPDALAERPPRREPIPWRAERWAEPEAA